MQETDTLAEWLRRWPAKPVVSDSVSSILTGIVFFRGGSGRAMGFFARRNEILKLFKLAPKFRDLAARRSNARQSSSICYPLSDLSRQARRIPCERETGSDPGGT